MLNDKKVGATHAARQIAILRKVFELAKDENLISGNPLEGYKPPKTKATPIVFLTGDELTELVRLELTPGILKDCRDLFLLQCNTGLDYGCMYELEARHIKKRHIEKIRQKSGVEAVIPLTPDAMRLLSQFTTNESLELPRYKNQTINRMLKELVAMCGIQKRLTTHVGRKTFGNLMMMRGHSLDAISGMLGHTSVKTTQSYYAKITKERILQEVG